MGLSPSSSRGASPPTAQGIYLQGTQAVLQDTGTKLAWTFNAGTALLDLTDPLTPLVITAGIYAISCNVQCESGTQASGVFYAGLELDRDVNDYTLETICPLVDDLTGGPAKPVTTLTGVGYHGASAPIRITVKQHVAASLNFKLYALVQRIT